MQHPELLMHRGRPEGPFVRPSPVGPRLPRLAAGATAGQACPRLAWSDLPMSYQDHVGKTETATDTVWPLLIRGLAATLDIPEPELSPAGRLPPLGHWMLFQDWTPAHGLGED